jgi:nucleotide-binding universal stress UspA family protein
MSPNPNYNLAIHDFQSAHLRAKLLSYEEIASKLRIILNYAPCESNLITYVQKKKFKVYRQSRWVKRLKKSWSAALFVATYLAEQWQTELTILTGLDDVVSDNSVQDFARNYLEFNEVKANFISKKYSAENLKATADEINADLVIMGGYSGSILKEMSVGSSVNFMLRESQLPILICR